MNKVENDVNAVHELKITSLKLDAVTRDVITAIKRSAKGGRVTSNEALKMLLTEDISAILLEHIEKNIYDKLFDKLEKDLNNDSLSREYLIQKYEEKLVELISQNFPEAGIETLQFIVEDILKEVNSKEKYNFRAIITEIRKRIRNKDMVLGKKTKRNEDWRAYIPLDQEDAVPEAMMLLRNSEARLNTIVDQYNCFKKYGDEIAEMIVPGIEAIVISSIEMILTAFEMIGTNKGVQLDVLKRRGKVLNSWPMTNAVRAYNMWLAEQKSEEGIKVYTEKEYEEDLKVLDSVIEKGLTVNTKELEKELIQITRLRDVWYGIATHQLLLTKKNKRGKYNMLQLEAFEKNVIRAAEEAMGLIVKDYNSRIDDAVNEVEDVTKEVQEKYFGNDEVHPWEEAEELEEELEEVKSKYSDIYYDNDVSSKITFELDSLHRQKEAWEQMSEFITIESEERIREMFFVELRSLLEDNQYMKNRDHEELLAVGEYYIDELMGCDNVGSFRRAFNKLVLE